MYRPHLRAPRRGVILLVVLLLLTLFALVGITFVLYADAAATSARVRREAESRPDPDVEPELLLAHFLGQLIYDANDETGLDSTLRGHSLARSLYGWNPDSPDGNAAAFNGTGRLHEPIPFTTDGRTTVLDGYQLVNYTCFRNPGGSLADGFLRDPERLGVRTGPGQAPGPYTGGFNAPYTYPDLNNMFLAAVRADGTVLLPSFHRPWTGFGPLDPSNPNWSDTTRPWLKYMVLRPRPAEMGPGFPLPEDAGGDVKNLIGGPGGNDSVWLDLDFPVLRAPDGRKYKPLFAPLIVDLDGRVNLNVHGNARGRDNMHLSNQGWGPWEVNPGWVLGPGEWANLLAGSRQKSRAGRYGPDGWPGLAGQQASFGPRPHSYAQVDFDASREGPGGLPTARFGLPGFGAPPLSCFPSFPAGYGNGAAGRRGSELLGHPVLSNPFLPTGDDRAFPASDLEALLRYGDTGSPALVSHLAHLCPLSFRDPRARRLVTTHSFDLDTPGTVPWLFDRDASAYLPPLGGAGGPPSGPAVPFPALDLRRTTTVPPHSDFRADWRCADGAAGRIDVNRFLPPYPHQGRGLTPADYRPTPLAGPAAWAQSLAAQTARQQLADEVYRRLLAVTGVAAPADPAHPTDADLVPRRWLAQLAANVVDFIDEDEVNTPFNFYTARDAGSPAFDAGALTADNPELPRYWVLGTELPRVVLNEVLTEYRLPPGGASGRFDVNVWVELFNPLPGGPPNPGVQPLDSRPVPLSAYRVVLANTNTDPGGPLLPRPGANDNVLGAPDVMRSSTDDADLAAPAGVGPQGFYLLGPPDPAPRPAGVPPATPVLRSANMTFPVRFTPPDTWSPDYRAAGITVLLRRLANPYLPPDPRPALRGLPNPAYNPFVTVDYLQGVPPNNAAGLAAGASRGKLQPYAADPGQVVPQVPAGNTLGRPNVPAPPAGRYDYLVHLDRRLISPMELLHVSGYPPHQLTHRFMSRGAPFGHRVPWFDEGNRLYRLFEFVGARTPSPGVAAGGRVPGKINLNTVWDPETLLALCDPQPGNHFTAADVYNPANPADPGTVFGRLLALRSPGGAPGPADRPFLSLAVGHSPGRGELPDFPAGDPLFPGGSGINDTLLRAAVRDGGPEAPRLFEVPGPHPYLRSELLTKIFNNVTTRSNVFAAWVTVGFFEVTDDTTRPVKLGAEVGRAEGRHRRHRMFAVIDRTNLTVSSTRSGSPVFRRGNPGPRTRYNPAADPGVVLYTSVID